MRAASDLSRAVQGASRALGELNDRVEHLKVALRDTPEATEQQRQTLDAIERRLDDIAVDLEGDSVKARANEPRPMSLTERVNMFAWAHWNALAAVTGNQARSLEVARAQFDDVRSRMTQAADDLEALEDEIAGVAPWTPGRIPELEQ